MNQSVSRMLVKEVCAHNPNFSASDVRGINLRTFVLLCNVHAIILERVKAWMDRRGRMHVGVGSVPPVLLHMGNLVVNPYVCTCFVRITACTCTYMSLSL